MDFGKRVAYIREREGIMQKELADMLGISARKLSDYERGESSPKDDTRVKIAKALDISMDYLYGLNDDIVSFSPKDAVMLPKGFPHEAIPKVKEQVRLLMTDHKARK